MSERRTSSLAPLVITGVTMVVLAVAVILGIVLSSGGDGGEDATPTFVIGPAVSVAVRDFRFEPPNVSVPAGARITWTNEDAAPHDATGDGDDWTTGTLEKGDAATVEFPNAGVFEYYCTIHPYMRGTITVRPD